MVRPASSVSITYRRFTVSGCIFAAVLLAAASFGGQLLDVYDDGLTTDPPVSASNIQDIGLGYHMRGSQIDGGGRSWPSGPVPPGGYRLTSLDPGFVVRPKPNPGGGGGAGCGGGGIIGGIVTRGGSGAPGSGRSPVYSGVRLDSGTYDLLEIDLALPAEGFSWVIGRSHNTNQIESGSHHDSDGYQGKNWFQISQPEIVLYDHPSDAAKDMIYIIYGADRYVEFKRDNSSSDEFKGVNGAVGVVQYAEGATNEPDTYTFTNIYGTQMVFFGFDGDASPAEGQIWKITDADSNTAYVGDSSTGSTAISNGFDGSGRISKAYDTNARRYDYTYATYDSITRLQKVEVLVDDSGYSATGYKVEYDYYGDESDGDIGDLKTVKVTTPLSESGTDAVGWLYYRYWEGTFNASTNPGHPHSIKYRVGYEGTRNFDWSESGAGEPEFDEGFTAAIEADLKPYASAYFEYDSSYRVVEGWTNGACGCGGASDGTFEITYGTNGSFSGSSGYDTDWYARAVVKQPDSTYVTQYFDEVGQPLHRVVTDTDPSGSPTEEWVTKITRNASGITTTISYPDNVTAYTHSTGAITTSTSAGLVRHYSLFTSGDMIGFHKETRFSKGTSGTKYFEGKWTYTSRGKTIGDIVLTRPFVLTAREYTQKVSSGTTGSNLRSYSYSFYSGDATLMPKKVTTTLPAVTTAKNGSNSSNSVVQYLRKDGTVAFTEAADDIFTYTQFTDGQLVKRIDDVKTNGTFPSGDDPNTDWGITESGSGSDRTTTIAYDDQGRMDTTTPPDGPVQKIYYSQIADRRQVTLSYADYETSPSTKYFGPVGYSVANHAGRAEVSGMVSVSGGETTLALANHVDETATDPILAIETVTNELGDIARLSTSVYDEGGSQLDESRLYISIPASGTGTEGTNFDATYYGYDDSGRQWRAKDPTGTIRRTVFDTRGFVSEQHVGTNDRNFDGGETSGTDNMVKSVSNEYDDGSDGGNGLLTKVTQYVVDGTTDKRETRYDHDLRGRTLLVTNPTAPHMFIKVDNMGRRVASGQFSSTASIVVGTDDPTTETTNRLALSQTFYDEMGRVWKEQRHKIDQDDGSDDDNLQSLTWYDAAGRTIKRQGQQLSKTSYDRLGRPSHTFNLAKDNDSAYTDADDVTGDIVLTESQTVYESTDSDDVLMRVSIERLHDDYSTGETTGALDSNADADDLKITQANVEGRVQIMATWYDRFGRMIDMVQYGTYGGSDFDRDGLSVPSRSDTALLTENEYNNDGSLKSVTDPRNLETRYTYDDAGRQAVVISNYINGTPSSSTGDDDIHTRFVYTDGLRTKMWVDIDGDGTEDAEDQVTTYTFGTTGGGGSSSDIATGHMLQKVQYPESSGGTDVVTFAYNAQGQKDYKKDQAGNIIEWEFDDSGRVEHEKATTIDADFDSDVERITTAYDNLGRRSTVTQYDNDTPGSGSVVDEVKYTYDDWGNVSKLEQDRDSTVGASGDYELQWSWTKAAASGTRYILKLSTVTLPSGNVITYTYSSTGDLHDSDYSRVTEVKDGAVVLASYDYNGAGHVVGTDLEEPDVMSLRYGTTSGSYPDLDRFNRITSSRWTKDLGTDVDFYDVDLTYDRNSNITQVIDNIHAGFDIYYTVDNLNRVTRALEGTYSEEDDPPITSTTRDEVWTLDQLGNWDVAKLDLDGDLNYNETDEFNDDRTHNVVNELTGRDTDDNGTDDYTLTYDEAGGLTDDGEHYEYVYDVWYRLRKVKKTSNQALVAEYRYNGLGWRIGLHFDVDEDGTVESTSDDPWYYFAYDDRWRMSARFEASDTAPTEEFIYHAAGESGRGRASYIDHVVLRDRDTDGNGSLDERRYYCQNWHHDVVAVVSDSGAQDQQGRHPSYGTPFGLPAADTDSDGDVDGTDTSQISTWSRSGPYNVLGDLDLDGDVDSTDESTASGMNGDVMGWGVGSKGDPDDGAHRHGYAGYVTDSVLAYSVFQVRHRVLNANLGRWMTRDPVEYLDAPSMYGYLHAGLLSTVDPSGLWGISLVSQAAAVLDTCQAPDGAFVVTQTKIAPRAPTSGAKEAVGFWVQKVSTWIDTKYCTIDFSKRQSFVFWEAKGIALVPSYQPTDLFGAIAGHFPDTQGFTARQHILRDAPGVAFKKCRRCFGTYHIAGTMRIYAASETFSDYPMDTNNPWLRGDDYHASHPAKDLHVKNSRPTWWSDGPYPDGELHHDLLMDWNCCDGCSKYVQGDFTPSATGGGTRVNWPDGPRKAGPFVDHWGKL